MKFRIWDGDSENWDECDHIGVAPQCGQPSVNLGAY